MTREEAIKDIEECVIPYVGGISLQMAVEDMKEMDRLAKAEPVLKEPQRPHGEWIWKEYDPDYDCGDIVCSNCSCVIQEGVPSERLKCKLWNFCPDCGSDNRKRGDEK